MPTDWTSRLPACSFPRLAHLFIALLVATGTLGCDKLEPRGTGPDVTDFATEIGLDQSELADNADADQPDIPLEPAVIETECMGTLTQNTERGEPVLIDFCDRLDDSGDGVATIRQITDEADLIPGPAAQGRVGDWLIDTGAARFIVQGANRTPTPCPYGGSIIDATAVGDGDQTPDNFGEFCFFLNLGRTLAPRGPENFEIVMDGSDGGPAVLAVTSNDTLLDWLSLANFAQQNLGFQPNTPFLPEDDLELTITHYYIANPGASEVHYLTAVRNDGFDEKFLIAGDLMDSGGAVQFFNPSASTGGFGYASVTPEDLNLLAFAGPESAHGYVPPINGIDEDGYPEVGSSYLAVSGVAASILGSTDPLALILTGDSSLDSPGVANLKRWDVHVWERRVLVAPTLSEITDSVIETREQPAGQLALTVEDEMGNGVPDVTVVPIRTDGSSEQAETRLVTEDDGTVQALLPPGDYELVVDSVDRVVASGASVSVMDGDDLEQTITLSAPGRVQVTVTDEDSGQPVPAKAVFVCDGPCPRPYRTEVRDINIDGWGETVGGVFYIGVDGTLDAPLPPGDYRMLVARGATWTTWPAAAAGEEPMAGAMSFTLDPGETETFDATLRKAVDTSNYVSADFHVHAINSPDAPVDNHDRVRTFLAAAVDLLISTDHDFITDYAPYVQALGAEGHIATMVGVELTTFDYGHYNSFPLVQDPDGVVGGAVDWAVDEGPPLHPAEIFDTLEDTFPGEQVIQVNHASGGYLSAISVDVARKISLQDPTVFRMPPVDWEETGDTELYDEGFTAIEVYNGYSRDKFWTLMNWWFAMVANGFVPAATACSDSHKMFSDPGGSPVSWVHVGPDSDTVTTLDPTRFVTATNGAELFGSNGPFVHFSASVGTGQGEQVSVGQTLSSSPGETVTLTAEIQVPLWMQVDRVQLYGNLRDTAPLPGQINGRPPDHLQEMTFQLDQSDLQAGPNSMGTKDRYVKEVTFEVAPNEDSFYVIIVEASEAHSMWPVVWSNTQPFAYTNPIFIDVDGGGFDAPGAIPADGGGSGGGRTAVPTRDLTREDLELLLERARHEH